MSKIEGFSEAQTRKDIIDPILKRSFWDVKGSYVKEEVNPVKSKFQLKEYEKIIYPEDKKICSS